ncbi:copper resistance protein B [Rhodanobacter terrae]|uniref:Copper resistance protein B n=1 Tax=Rhodanobacter terrae TaxID=418647 RepID=A0ABW0SZC2_9GAMM
MKMHRRNTSIVPPRSALLAALLLASPLTGAAQSAPASSSGTAPMGMGAMPGMDRAGMHDMAMPAGTGSAANPAKKSPVRKAKKPNTPVAPTPSSTGMQGMGDMDHGSAPAAPVASGHDMPLMDPQAVPDANHGAAHDMDSAPGMTIGPMQGGHAPADARSGDYSDGIAAAPAHGLHMHGSAPVGMLLVDQLEAFDGRDANGQSWEIQGWYGNDSDKLWLRSEGERSRGKLEDANVEAFWNHSMATFWNTQLGVRHDFGEGPARSWAAFGVQGLAPYWFELEATGYVGAGSRTAARLRAEYELLFTQRLILQPEAEINLYGKSDPQRHIGSGISDVQFGLRLRYEIRRQFAPYVGVNWVRRVGTSADYARQYRQPVLDRQIVAGVRIWF